MKLMSPVPYKEDDHTINMEEVQGLSCEGLEAQTIYSISKTTQPKEYNQEILAVEIVKNEKEGIPLEQENEKTQSQLQTQSEQIVLNTTKAFMQPEIEQSQLSQDFESEKQ